MVLTGVEFFVVVEKCCGCPKPVGERKIGVVGLAVVAELVDTSVGGTYGPEIGCERGTCDCGATGAVGCYGNMGIRGIRETCGF